MADDIVTTNVRLSRDVHRRLRSLAAAEGRSLSDLLREASAEYVARREGAIPDAEWRRDPFFVFLARVESEEAPGDTDLATAHDRYLDAPAGPPPPVRPPVPPPAGTPRTPGGAPLGPSPSAGRAAGGPPRGDGAARGDGRAGGDGPLG